jgi:O-antigen biosynthesis protein
MTKTVFLSHDVHTINGVAGGVAAFTTNLATLLRRQNEDVTIIAVRKSTSPFRIDEAWRKRYAELGIDLLEIHSGTQSVEHRPHDAWTMYLGEKVEPHLRDADVIYAQDWGNPAAFALRKWRYERTYAPSVVTVLHGPSVWARQTNRLHLQVTEDLHLEFTERYAAQHSDFVVSPSQFMVNWTRKNGWVLPEHVPVLGLPILPLQSADRPMPSSGVGRIQRLIYFGRVETRKGIDTFIAALNVLKMREPEHFSHIEQVVLLGANDVHFHRPVRPSITALQELGLTVQHVAHLDSPAARQYLAEHANNSLVVIPSPSDNFPYAVVEASMIPNLTVIAARGGGIPEILGERTGQLFDPHPHALAAKIADMLESGTRTPDQLSHYDHTAANERWLSFHRKVVETTKQRRGKPRPIAAPANVTQHSADVILPTYNNSRYLPLALAAMERQTSQDFSVIVLDDGSYDPEAVAVFDQMRAKYTPRGWTFISQTNQFADAARNNAAKHSTAEFLIFFDSDDVPALNLVERFLEAIRLSGDDCLISSSYYFEGEGMPFDLNTGKVTVPPFVLHKPLGSSLVAAIADPVALGSPVMIIRRSVFEEIGGYREWHGVIHEEWELQAKLALAGYRVDVLPDFLQFYRRVPGTLSTRTNRYLDRLRLAQAYEEYLQKIGLGTLAYAFQALYEQVYNPPTFAASATSPFTELADRRGKTQLLTNPTGLLKTARDTYHAAVPLQVRMRLRRARLRLLGR